MMPITLREQITLVSANGTEVNHDANMLVLINLRQIEKRLNSMHDGVPVILQYEHSGRYSEQLIIYFCTPDFILRCVIEDDVILILSVKSTSTLYSRLSVPAWKSINVKPRSWQVLSQSDGDHYVPAIRQTILDAYTKNFVSLAIVGRKSNVDRLSDAHNMFLTNVEKIVEALYKVEFEKAQESDLYTYVSVEAIARERVSDDKYLFTIEGEFKLEKRASVWVGIDGGGIDEGGLRESAIVDDIDGSRITLHFPRKQIDLKRLVSPGFIGSQPSDVQKRVQLGAINDIRDRKALNPSLLEVIVDHRFKSFVPSNVPAPEALLPDQAEAFQKSLAVPDLLLVWGPPGTGKTTTIVQIVLELARQHKKVLIASKTNLAVDNVLKRLINPADPLRLLRIGDETKVSAKVTGLLIDEQAKQLQELLTRQCSRNIEFLKKLQKLWPDDKSILSELRRQLDVWQQTNQKLQRVRDTLWEQYNNVIRNERQRTDTLYSRLNRAVQAETQSGAVLSKLIAYTKYPVVGMPIVLLAAAYSWLFLRPRRRRTMQITSAYMSQVSKHNRLVEDYNHAVEASDAVLKAKQQLIVDQELARTLYGHTLEQLGQSEQLGTAEDLSQRGLDYFQQQITKLQRHFSFAAEQLSLLRDWMEHITGERQQTLYPALIRSADVVGATCIGISSNARFRDVEFDTVIIDEAGQIQVFDVLVPLVRAKRAILVGDHKQLPPLVEDGVAQILLGRFDDENEDHQPLIELQEKSLFELLYDKTPLLQKCILDTQRRMPALIADFISDAFYDNNYKSLPHLEPKFSDPFFDKPLVFIDTSGERDCLESSEGTSWKNLGEAAIIARLVDTYLAQGVPLDDLGVIVPYKPQVQCVKDGIRANGSSLSNSELDTLVATLDSFQGDEHEIILLGFTRSNKYSVGFWRETRRLNVALTRARRLVVIVGNLRTMTEAGDADFNKLARQLKSYIRENGQLMTVRDLNKVIYHG